MPHPGLFLCFSLLTLALALPALAVMSDSESPRQVSNDPDYTAGLAAFQRADWQNVLDTMARVVARRPWDDEAQNLMGFASRKLGNYHQALGYYQKALELNQHHRGALEYLGETYLEMGGAAQACVILARLEAACKRLIGDTASTTWPAGCQEWTELHAAITAYHEPAQPGCPLE
jgi:tetratricopeptide (TPR) repeat protein